VRVKKSTKSRSLQPAWALATLGLIFALWANLKPIMSFDVAGNTQTNHILTGVTGLFDQGYGAVGVLVFFCAIAAPALHLGAIWYVASACCLGQRWPGVERVNHLAEVLSLWNLAPVFAIGCVVAVVKLDMLGTVVWHSGAAWLVALSLCSILTVQFFDDGLVEENLERLP